MRTVENGNTMKDMLKEVCKLIANQDVVIRTLSGETYMLYEPVTIHADFIRFQDSDVTAPGGNHRTVNVPYAAIESFSHP